MDEQQYREKRCAEIVERLAELKIEKSQTSPKGPTNHRYNQLEGKITQLIQEVPNVLFYSMTDWKAISDHLPMRVYEYDHKKFGGEVSAKLDAHRITEAEDDVMVRDGKEIEVVKFYCQECQQFVAVIQKNSLSQAIAFIPWSEAQRL